MSRWLFRCLSQAIDFRKQDDTPSLREFGLAAFWSDQFCHYGAAGRAYDLGRNERNRVSADSCVSLTGSLASPILILTGDASGASAQERSISEIAGACSMPASKLTGELAAISPEFRATRRLFCWDWRTLVMAGRGPATRRASSTVTGAAKSVTLRSRARRVPALAPGFKRMVTVRSVPSPAAPLAPSDLRIVSGDFFHAVKSGAMQDDGLRIDSGVKNDGSAGKRGRGRRVL